MSRVLSRMAFKTKGLKHGWRIIPRHPASDVFNVVNAKADLGVALAARHALVFVDGELFSAFLEPSVVKK